MPHDESCLAGRQLACMEVWGGSSATDQVVRVPGNDVHIACVPHAGGQQGGDIYYVSNCASGLITRFALADVAGHGVQVASLAVELRNLMRRHINTANQTRFAIELNQAFGNLDLGGRFATAILATYFAPTDHLILCNAGHPRPLLYRAASNAWELLDGDTPGSLSAPRHGREVGIANLPLGIVDPTSYQQFAIRLQPGDLVVMYTDALIEASLLDTQRSPLGENGLLAIASRLAPQERENVASALRSKVVEFAGGAALDDDATLVVLRHTAENPPPISWHGQVGRIARMLGIGAVDSGPEDNP